MNRRNFLKGAILGMAATTVPLAVAAPGTLDLPLPTGWDTLFPWQKQFVLLVRSGRNVRLSGGARSGKSHVARVIFRDGELRHLSHMRDMGSVVEIRQHDGPIDVEAAFSMVKNLWAMKGDHVSEMFTMVTRPYSSQQLSPRSYLPRTPQDQS